MRTSPRIQIPCLDPRVTSQVIHNRLAASDIIVNKRRGGRQRGIESSGRRGTANHRDAGQGVYDGTDGGAVAVAVDFDLGLADGDEFGVEGEDGGLGWALGEGVEGGVRARGGGVRTMGC